MTQRKVWCKAMLHVGVWTLGAAAMCFGGQAVAQTGQTASAQAPAVLSALQADIDGPQRTAAFRTRDPDRHPGATLSFFGLSPDMHVVEIWPGNGWYAEILAPYLKDGGLLYEALPEDANNRGAANSGSSKEAVAFSQKLASDPNIYGKVVMVPFAPTGFHDIKPPGGADLVLTFRNVHNWMKNGMTDTVFADFFAALKPGGTLGVVEHRAQPGTSLDKMISSGYVTEQYVIQHAQAAGFKLVAKSEVNANPKDNTDHPNGVWSLPPSYAGGDKDRALFQSIGESDRMTLRFVKPGPTN